jgi:hypothetical protein
MQTPLEYPHTQCLPGGIPLSLFVFTFKIIQTPEEIVMLAETADPPRQIHTDGRPLPKDPDPAWMGYSVGHWAGDTLVVDTTGFNERRGLTDSATRAANPCTSPSAIIAVILVTWIWRSPSTIRSTTRDPSASRLD